MKTEVEPLLKITETTETETTFQPSVSLFSPRPVYLFSYHSTSVCWVWMTSKKMAGSF